MRQHPYWIASRHGTGQQKKSTRNCSNSREILIKCKRISTAIFLTGLRAFKSYYHQSIRADYTTVCGPLSLSNKPWNMLSSPVEISKKSTWKKVHEPKLKDLWGLNQKLESRSSWLLGFCWFTDIQYKSLMEILRDHDGNLRACGSWIPYGLSLKGSFFPSSVQIFPKIN